MSLDRTVTCETALDALVAGSPGEHVLAHLTTCPACRGVANMTRSIRVESEPIPSTPGQRPRWIAELHAAQGRRRRAWIAGGLAVVTAAAVLVTLGLGGGSPERDSTTTTTTTTPPLAPPVAEVTGAAPGLRAEGYLEARMPVRLSSAIRGKVKAVHVKAGDQVTRGQLLAVMDDAPIRSQLALAAKRRLDAIRELERAQRLWERQVLTNADLQDRKRALRDFDATLAALQAQLAETAIKSPIDGTVLEVLAQPGDLRTDDDAGVLLIADLTALVVKVRVGAAGRAGVQAGQACEVAIDDQPDGTSRGVVQTRGDDAGGDLLVTIDVKAPSDSRLRPGMAVRVTCAPEPPPQP